MKILAVVLLLFFELLGRLLMLFERCYCMLRRQPLTLWPWLLVAATVAVLAAALALL